MNPSLHFHSKPRKKRKRPEANLQETVVEHLRMIPMPGVLHFSIPNEGERSQEAKFALCRMGMRPGAADLVIVVPGKPPLFLELKAKGGVQSPEQVAFQHDAIRAGCRYELADSIDAATTILSEYGAIRLVKRYAA